MNRIVAVIPTYHRAHLLPAFIKNHNENSTESTLFFVIHPKDKESRKVLTSLKQNYLLCEGEYVECINTGFKFTQEPFVLCAADDVVFTPGWDKAILEMADNNRDKHIFGGVDEWQISLTQKHISHPVVRRTHFSDPLYNPLYIHYMCDIEFEQRGFLEGSVMITPRVLIEHPHTVTAHLDKEAWDETYKKSFSKIKLDESLYHRRKGEFEVWDFTELNGGRVVPTKLNPVYNKTLVSIVIPSYRDYKNLKNCLASVVNNTFYRYEIIVIDDGPEGEVLEPWNIVNKKLFLDSIELEDKSCTFKVVHNKKQEWVNHNWNVGAEMATGDYVAFLNSDITLSKDWDKYLVSALEHPQHPFTVACPYETNINTPVPFTLDPLILKYIPNMIKGPCFMMRKSDVPFIFPIPKQIKHWCGDNWISDKSESMNGTVFAKKAVINHLISQSSNTLKPSVLQNRTYKDIIEYEKLSGNKLNFIKSRFPEVVKAYYWVDDHES